MFLKYLDDLEKNKKTAAELSGMTYTNIIALEFEWTVWAMPKSEDGKLDYHNALAGDDLKDFVTTSFSPTSKSLRFLLKVPTPLNIKLMKYSLRRELSWMHYRLIMRI